MKPTRPLKAQATARTRERRAFMVRAGTALSGTLAGAAAAGAVPRDGHDRAQRTDTDAIRALNRRYGELLNQHHYEDLVRLFADDAEVRFNGGVFLGRRGVRRLYVGHFGGHVEGSPRDTGEPVHTLMLCAPGDPQDIELAADRRSARAHFRRVMQVEAAIVSTSALVEMARQQGEGVARWWEDGAYEVAYTKSRAVWKIRRLAYHASAPAAALPGRSSGPPRHVRPYSNPFPQHPTGPDRLIDDPARAAVKA